MPKTNRNILNKIGNKSLILVEDAGSKSLILDHTPLGCKLSKRTDNPKNLIKNIAKIVLGEKANAIPQTIANILNGKRNRDFFTNNSIFFKISISYFNLTSI
jgi:hypothetical protein